MYSRYEDAEKDYVQSVAKLLNGSYHKVEAGVEQPYYEVGGIVATMPVAAKIIIKMRADHYVELFIKIIDMQTNSCVYTLRSSPDFVYENLEKWVAVKTRELMLKN